MSRTRKKKVKAEKSGSSPVGRGGAGTYIEGQLGAYYLLQMLAGSDARGLPNAKIERVQLQGENEGYALDDLIVHGVSDKGTALLEIQSKRTIRFSPLKIGSLRASANRSCAAIPLRSRRTAIYWRLRPSEPAILSLAPIRTCSNGRIERKAAFNFSLG